MELLSLMVLRLDPVAAVPAQGQLVCEAEQHMQMCQVSCACSLAARHRAWNWICDDWVQGDTCLVVELRVVAKRITGPFGRHLLPSIACR